MFILRLEKSCTKINTWMKSQDMYVIYIVINHVLLVYIQRRKSYVPVTRIFVKPEVPDQGDIKYIRT